MNKEILVRLEKLNQLRLTEEQRADVLAFFDAREADMAAVDAVNTAEVERMVHVMPLENVLRADVADQPFTREALQAAAPAAEDGYWQVPRTVD